MSNQVCTMCGFVGAPRKVVRGSFWIEIILWLMFIIPGLVYSIWRLTTKKQVCPKCKNPTMIPIDTPMGQKFMSEGKS